MFAKINYKNNGGIMSQIELFDKMLIVTICSLKGHKKCQVELSRVRDFLLKETEKSRLWLYIDGVQIDPKNINTNLLSSSKFVILTNALVGG